MARRTFFSFHYKADVTRANVAKNAWVTKEREEAGFFDASAFEKAERTSPDALKAFINRALDGSSVVCALVGAETALRRWVRYEIQRAIWDAKGLLAVRIHTIKNFDQKVATAGTNPFDLLGVYVKDKSMWLVERSSTTSAWSYSSDFGQVIPKWPYTTSLPADGSHPLSEFVPIYDWANDGYTKLGTWIETAATKAGR